MAADFIEQDGNIYLRLTGNTTQILFNAASGASNTYTMTIAGLQIISTGSLYHEFNDSQNTVNGIPGNTDITFQPDGGGATFQALNGDYEPGVVYNPNDLGPGGSFASQVGGDITITFSVGQNPTTGTQITPFNAVDTIAKYYTVTWNTAFPNNSYSLNINIDINLSASGVNPLGGKVVGVVKRADGFDLQLARADNNLIGFIRQFSAVATAPFSISKNGGINDPSYVGTGQVITVGGSGTRYYLVTGVNQNGTQYTTTNTSNFLCLGDTVLEFQNGVIAHPGVAKNKNLFVKNSGNWKPSRNIFIKDAGTWKQCEKVWIKSGGVWKESYVRNSSVWVNMLELYDDTLDFAVQVVAQN